jgi:hypothetical protein
MYCNYPATRYASEKNEHQSQRIGKNRKEHTWKICVINIGVQFSSLVRFTVSHIPFNKAAVQIPRDLRVLSVPIILIAQCDVVIIYNLE